MSPTQYSPLPPSAAHAALVAGALLAGGSLLLSTLSGSGRRGRTAGAGAAAGGPWPEDPPIGAAPPEQTIPAGRSIYSVSCGSRPRWEGV